MGVQKWEWSYENREFLRRMVDVMYIRFFSVLDCMISF